jgi:prepilin-type N-terminal cleavage/methylation domain-containing protein
MKIFFKFKRQSGFSMIEVLVAVAILGFGLLALAALQTVIIRSSSESKAQSVAIALAKEKIEFFRRFTDITGYQAIDAGSDPLSVLGGVEYARVWTVDRYVFEDDVDNDAILNETNDQAFVKYTTSNIGSTPAGYVSNNEFKVIKVTVSWTDSQGVSQNVVLDDAIGALSPRDSALIAKTPLLTGPRVIPYQIIDPAGDAMVIPIAIGGGTNSAATNPKPQVLKGNSTVETTFEVLTYAGLNGGTATAQQRVETTVIGCTCKYGLGGTTPGMRPTVWNGYRYAPPVSATAAPLAGPDPDFVNLQSSNCSICCRDHHDPVGEKGPTFSPRFVTKNSSTGVVTASHPHYVDKLTATPVTTGSYKEACRIVRVDGILRVASDLSNDYFGLLATGDGTSALTPIPDSTSVQGTPPVAGGAVKRYQNFVVDYLKSRVVTPSPSSSAAISVYNSVGTPGILAASAPYVLDNPTSISINLADTIGKWLHSRGLYVDYLEDDAVQAITDAKADSFCNSSAENLTACILKRMPFTSINLSEISDWSPLSGPLSVTNNDYSTSLTQGNPVRGKVTTAATTATTVNAISTSRKYNTSLLDLLFDAISPEDDIKHSDTQPFAIAGGSPSSGAGNGLVPVTVVYSGTATPVLSYYTSGTTSSLSCGIASTGSYSCNVQNGSATAGLDVNGGLFIDISGYNHQQAQGTNTNLVNCQGIDGLKSFSIQNNWVAATGSVCRNYQVTSVTSASPNNPNIGTINFTNVTLDGRVNPAPGEVTRISFSGKVASSPPNSIAIALSLQETVQQTYSSCSYICTDTITTGGGPCRTNGNDTITFSAIYPACP